MQPNTPRLITPRSLVLSGMIVFAVAVRLLAYFQPDALPLNFSPVMAIAIFGGALFTDRRLALLVPLLAMFASDLVIGLHALIPVVYGCMALGVLLGSGLLRRKRSALRVIAASVGGATGFYLITNFFVWLTSGMYAMSAAGLGACYLAGLPFYQYGSLPGTLLWSGVLFGGFALLSHRYKALNALPQPAR
ncbi:MULTISPECIES: DUF6580 family putative transport protein [Oleiagrimonas]|uniref:Rod shape-determining protein MreD n=1 Tax=Oleiagrimonas citrea TaxID=1665687 RepID=A0A846ZQ14_9GAMM|nr:MULTISPECIES: DUF6580 family putative transport protein [Oleiagrimonas]NKZ39533.1 hypothetical protein [Oleiagrimonas citrea]